MFTKKRLIKLGLLVALVGIPLVAYAATAPKNLKAIDTPADEECLTFETDYNAFEWVNCHATTFTTDVTLENSEFIDNGTNGTINLGRNNAGTVTLGSLDDDSTAALTIDPGGATTLTLGGTTDTVIVAATSGFTLENSESINAGTDATFDFTRNDAGVVTITCSDDDASAGCVYDAGGASPIVVGSADVTAITLTTDDTGTAEAVLPVNSVGPTEFGVHTEELIICGENAENSTVYFGPATGPFGGDGSDISRGSAGCDALDNATESTADAAVSTLAMKVHGFRCTSDATMGSGETQVFTLRTAEGNAITTDGASTTLTCTIGEGATECRTNDSTTTNIAAGATVAMKVVAVDNNADGDESWCKLTVSFP